MTFIYDKVSNNYYVYSDSNTWAVSNSTPRYNTSPQSAIMSYPVYDVSTNKANSFYFLVDNISPYIQYCDVSNSASPYDVANIVVNTTYVSASSASPYSYPKGLAVSNTGARAVLSYGGGANAPKIVSEILLSYSPFTISRPSGANSWVYFSRPFRNMYVNNTANMLFTSNSTHIHKYVGNALTCSLSYSSEKTVNSDNLGVFFSTDGTKLYTLGSSRIYQYTLSTAWNISTASISGSYDISTIDSSPKALCFSSDGLYCYFIGAFNNKIFRLELVSPFDITSIMYTGDSTNITTTLSGSENGIAIKNNGTVIYVNNGYSVKEILLPTPYTLNSSVNSSNTSPNTDRLRFSYGLAMPDDGYHIFINNGSAVLHKLNMSDQWSTSSANYQEVDVGLLTARNRVSAVNYVRYGDNGKKLYISGTSPTDTIVEYNLATPYVLSTATYSSQTSAAFGQINFYVANNRLITYGSNTLKSYILTTDWSISSAVIDTNNNSIRTLSAMTITPNGTELLVSNTTSPYSLYKYSLNTANVPKSAYYPTVNKGWLNAGDTSMDIKSARYSQDGKYLFYLEDRSGGNTNIVKYTLSTPWDLSTASIAETFKPSYLMENMKFSYDGRYMFLNYSGGVLQQWVLSTPWTLSSASLLNYITSQFSAIAVSTKGDKFYGFVSSFYTGKGNLKEYILGDRWNVRSSTSNASVAYLGYTPDTYDIEFSPTGKYMYRVLSNSVIRYTMSTPWSVSSIVQDSTYSIPGTSMGINSIHFDTYGNEYIITDYTHKSVFKFNT